MLHMKGDPLKVQGVTYYYTGWRFSAKKQAVAYAKSLRKQGKSTQLVPVEAHRYYEVFSRPAVK